MFEELEDAGTVQSTDVASMNVAIVDGDPSDVKHFKAEVSIKFAPCTVMERGPPVVGPNVGDRWVIVLGRVYVKSALVGEKWIPLYVIDKETVVDAATGGVRQVSIDGETYDETVYSGEEPSKNRQCKFLVGRKLEPETERRVPPEKVPVDGSKASTEGGSAYENWTRLEAKAISSKMYREVNSAPPDADGGIGQRIVWEDRMVAVVLVVSPKTQVTVEVDLGEKFDTVRVAKSPPSMTLCVGRTDCRTGRVPMR
jgi:hypothetical protein